MSTAASVALCRGGCARLDQLPVKWAKWRWQWKGPPKRAWFLEKVKSVEIKLLLSCVFGV